MERDNFQISVNEGEWTFDVSKAMAEELDIVQEKDNQYHILYKNQAYRMQVLELDEGSRNLRIRLNGQTYTLHIADHFERLINKMGLQQAGTLHVKDIKAPMPGLVLSIEVTAGEKVAKGDPLLILEAMKMENIIKSPGDGVVKHIAVGKGKAVEKGALLIEME